MNTVRLAPFFNVAINSINSDGYYAVCTVTNAIKATIAIENSDHGDDVNNFGMVKLHDFSDIKLSDIKFAEYENDTACHVPALNRVVIDLDSANQLWAYNDEEEYCIDAEKRLVQIVQNDNVQQYYL